MYAWWMSPGSIARVRGPAHPIEELELLYVGIAPQDERSRATLRSRIVNQHLGGNIGSSTFRQSLAALLFEEHGWATRWSGCRVQLLLEANRSLSEWQGANLRLAWVEHPLPWAIEREVISVLGPPLNLAGNATHEMHGWLEDRRAQLRSTSVGGE